MRAWRRNALILAGLGLTAQAAASGQAIFAERCADCHRASGEGLPPTFPALKGSALAQGDPAPLINTVLNGRRGLSAMPAWKETLNDQEIAAVLTYVRSAWGNQAGPVLPEQVRARRK